MPLIYSEDYNISFLGIEKFHPFDSWKYKKVYDYLVDKANIPKTSFIQPKALDDKLLLKVHTQRYLDSLNEPVNIARISEMYVLKNLPAMILKNSLLNPMKLATSGTIMGAQLALTEGWAINLSGGYHHAKSDEGGGFCFFADIPLAIHIIKEKHPMRKIVIIDLDAHQGNGIESIVKDDPWISIFDIYNKEIYPADYEAAAYIKYKFPVNSHIADEAYLAILNKNLPEILDVEQPELVIYNAGTDVFEGDPLGIMNITDKGIIKRDEIVFHETRSRKIPILMVLSGGYTNRSGEVIGRSIENLFRLKLIE